VSTEKRKREEEEKRGTKFMLGKKDAKTVKEANKSKKERIYSMIEGSTYKGG
jgi:hypothetical protein